MGVVTWNAHILMRNFFIYLKNGSNYDSYGFHGFLMVAWFKTRIWFLWFSGFAIRMVAWFLWYFFGFHASDFHQDFSISNLQGRNFSSLDNDSVTSQDQNRQKKFLHFHFLSLTLCLINEHGMSVICVKRTLKMHDLSI